MARTAIGATILRRLCKNQTIALPPCAGSHLISQASKVFTGCIDEDFVNYGANEPGTDTPQTPVAVYEMAEDTTFKQMVHSVSDNVESLCLTQAQIIAFCEKHRDKLRTGGFSTFFLFKSGDNFFVASVFVDDGELGVDIDHFDDGYVWYAYSRHRVVVPQIG